MLQMMTKKVLYYSLLTFSVFLHFSYAQEKEISVSGKVFLEGEIPAEAAVIQVQALNRSHAIITDQHGAYSLKSFKVDHEADTISLKCSYFGYADTNIVLKISENKSVEYDFHLDEQAQELEGVTLTGDRKRITEQVNRISFAVNPNDYLKNAKADQVLNSIPSLSYNDQHGIKIEGDREALIFIYGIESSLDQYLQLSVQEIESVDVVYNPSARYGSEFTGGIINVKLKTPIKT